jgi:membrane-associated protein
MLDFLESLVTLVSASPWTYAAILAVAALDALVPVVPSEATVISAGVLAAAGDLQLGFVIVAGAAGAYAGDTSAYWLGRRFGRRFERRVFRGAQAARRREWAERTLERHGGVLIFGARFIPGGRTAVTVSAGLIGMRWARFATFAGAAAIAWASYAGLAGYLGGRAFESSPFWGLLLGFGVAAVVFAGVTGVQRIRPRHAPVSGDDPLDDDSPEHSPPAAPESRPRRSVSASRSSSAECSRKRARRPVAVYPGPRVRPRRHRAGRL